MMVAPASAAPIAASAISFAVTGRYGDMLGVWIAPVTAQVMITLFVVISKPSRLRPYPLAAGRRKPCRNWSERFKN
jgi:hypothetical protein